MDPNHDIIVDDVRDTLAVIQTDIKIAESRLQTLSILHYSSYDRELNRDNYDKALSALQRSIDRLTTCRVSVLKAREIAEKER